MKKIFAILLSVIMVTALCATVVYAEGETNEEPVEAVGVASPEREVPTIATISDNTYDPTAADAPDSIYVTDEEAYYVRFYDYTEGTYKYVLESTVPAEDSYTVYELTVEIVETEDGKTLKATSTAAFADFVSVSVDGKVVDAENYTVEEGSTVVTFTVAYFETLGESGHEIAVNSNNGYAMGTFGVADDIAATDDSDAESADGAEVVEGAETENPQTGDSTNIFLWIAIAAVAACGIGVLAVSLTKSKRTN